MKKNVKTSLWVSLKRGLLGRCPQCGRGKLFKGYLKQVQSCLSCGEKLDHIRADDGPAWLSILLAGHLMIPFILAFNQDDNLPEWAAMTLWPLLSVVLILMILPRTKGLFIALIWRQGH